MTRKVPFVPTVVVLLAVAIMVALGIWQLGRADEKEALLARYAAAGDDRTLVAWPTTEACSPASRAASRMVCGVEVATR